MQVTKSKLDKETPYNLFKKYEQKEWINEEQITHGTYKERKNLADTKKFRNKKKKK